MKTFGNASKSILVLAGLAALGLATFPGAADAQTYAGKTVRATDSVEAAGQTTAPDGATFPTAYTVPGGGTLTFTSVIGSITFNGGGNFNDPDGVGSASATNISALNGVSGIAHTSKAGYLVGLFTTNTAPSGTAPAGLTFSDPGSGTGISTNFATLSPLLNQTFFVGDGLTGDGTGAAQKFFIPAGATQLYLGFADASGYNGTPGSYGDNSGSFTASFTAAPEPSEVAGLSLGALLLGGLAVKGRKRQPV